MTPIYTPKYYSPFFWGDPRNGTPNFGKPQVRQASLVCGESWSAALCVALESSAQYVQRHVQAYGGGRKYVYERECFVDMFGMREWAARVGKNVANIVALATAGSMTCSREAGSSDKTVPY